MTSISFSETELKISKETTIKLNNYLREISLQKLIANPTTLWGPNKTVEIDKDLLTRRKNEVGCIFPQHWVFGGICMRHVNDFWLQFQIASMKHFCP